MKPLLQLQIQILIWECQGLLYLGIGLQKLARGISWLVVQLQEAADWKLATL